MKFSISVEITYVLFKILCTRLKSKNEFDICVKIILLLFIYIIIMKRVYLYFLLLFVCYRMEVIHVKKAQCSDHVVYVENCLLSKQCMQIHVTVNSEQITCIFEETMLVCLLDGVYCHYQQYFSYIIGCQFYWWRKPEDPEKTTDLSQVTDKLYDVMLYTSP
jgi:hypothetical protein